MNDARKGRTWELEEFDKRSRRDAFVAVMALAFASATLLAGCGGGSSEAADPVPSAAGAVPTSSVDGLVKPAGVDDDVWAVILDGFKETDRFLATASPEQVATACESLITDTIQSDAEKLGSSGQGSTQEWLAVYTKAADNFQAMACAMVKQSGE